MLATIPGRSEQKICSTDWEDLIIEIPFKFNVITQTLALGVANGKTKREVSVSISGHGDRFSSPYLGA